MICVPPMHSNSNPLRVVYIILKYNIVCIKTESFEQPQKNTKIDEQYHQSLVKLNHQS